MSQTLTATTTKTQITKLGTAWLLQPQDGDVNVGWGDSAPAQGVRIDQDAIERFSGHEGNAEDDDVTVHAQAWAAPTQPGGADVPGLGQSLIDVGIGVFL